MPEPGERALGQPAYLPGGALRLGVPSESGERRVEPVRVGNAPAGDFVDLLHQAQCDDGLNGIEPRVAAPDVDVFTRRHAVIAKQTQSIAQRG